MNARFVIRLTDLSNALGNSSGKRQELLALKPHVILDDRKGGVRQQVHPLQNGAIKLEWVVLVTRGEDRNRCLRNGRAVLGGNDLRHRLFLGKRRGVRRCVAACRRGGTGRTAWR